MRIIAESRDRVVNCKNCDCLYEYTLNDVRPIGIGAFGLICPKCQTLMIFKMTPELKEVEQIEIKGDDDAGSSV